MLIPRQKIEQNKIIMPFSVICVSFSFSFFGTDESSLQLSFLSRRGKIWDSKIPSLSYCKVQLNALSSFLKLETKLSVVNISYVNSRGQLRKLAICVCNFNSLYHILSCSSTRGKSECLNLPQMLCDVLSHF